MYLSPLCGLFVWALVNLDVIPLAVNKVKHPLVILISAIVAFSFLSPICATVIKTKVSSDHCLILLFVGFFVYILLKACIQNLLVDKSIVFDLLYQREINTSRLLPFVFSASVIFLYYCLCVPFVCCALFKSEKINVTL